MYQNFQIQNKYMNIDEFSKEYQVRYLKESDIDDILLVMDTNPQYYDYCKPSPSRESIISDMNALPPNKTLTDKYYVGYYLDNKLICILDLISKYPDEKTAFIGFFMINKNFQNKNRGSFIIKELTEYLKKESFEKIKLGYVEGNCQSKNFWLKNGFVPTGTISKQKYYNVVVMNKNI